MTTEYNPFLDNKWLKKHSKNIRNLAGPRYFPELHIETNLFYKLQALIRDPGFSARLKDLYEKLNETKETCNALIARDKNIFSTTLQSQ